MKKSLQLPDYEYTRLRKLYRDEFENTITRLKQLEEILSTFDEEPKQNRYNEIPEKVTKVTEVLKENTPAQLKPVAVENKQEEPAKVAIKKKRGRKSKKEKELELLAKESASKETDGEIKEVKRRGRPKGKKSNTETINESQVDFSKLNFRKFIKSNISRRNKFVDSAELFKAAQEIYIKMGLTPDLIADKLNKTVDSLIKAKVLIKTVLNDSLHIGLYRWVTEDGIILVKYNPYESLEKDKKKNEANNFINSQPLALDIKNEILHYINHSPVKNQLVIKNEFYDYIIQNKKIIQNNSEIETKGLIDHVLDLLIRTDEIFSMPLKSGDGVQFGLKHWLKKGNGELKSYYMTR